MCSSDVSRSSLVFLKREILTLKSFRGTAYIFLCPAFFLQLPITEKRCPAIRNNIFTGSAGAFYQDYDTYTLLYYLIRFYLGHEALDDTTRPKERLNWNECVAFNLLDSVLNPTNLQIYVASKQIQSKSPRRHLFTY